MPGSLPRKANGQWIGAYGPNEPRPCVDCGETKEASEFHAKRKARDGTIKTRQSYCRECGRLRVRAKRGCKPRTRQTPEEINRKKREKYRRDMRDPEARERKREQDREAARRRRARAKVDAEVRESFRQARAKWLSKAYRDEDRRLALNAQTRERNRRRMESLREDPAAYEDYVSIRRMDARLRTGAVATKPQAVGAWRRTRNDLPAEPLLAWLASAFPGETAEQLEARTGVNAKRFRDIRAGQMSVDLATVDRIFTLGLGRPDLVAALYPVE